MKQRIISQLLSLKHDLNSLQDNFYIIGSSGLILQDIEIGNTGDIDIVASDKDAESLKMLWKQYIRVNPKTKEDDLFISNFASYDFDLMDVEVMGELRIHINGTFEKLTISEFLEIKLDTDFTVKVPSLEEFKRILSLFGREKDLVKLKILSSL